MDRPPSPPRKPVSTAKLRNLSDQTPDELQSDRFKRSVNLASTIENGKLTDREIVEGIKNHPANSDLRTDSGIAGLMEYFRKRAPEKSDRALLAMMAAMGATGVVDKRDPQALKRFFKDNSDIDKMRLF